MQLVMCSPLLLQEEANVYRLNLCRVSGQDAAFSAAILTINNSTSELSTIWTCMITKLVRLANRRYSVIAFLNLAMKTIFMNLSLFRDGMSREVVGYELPKFFVCDCYS